MVLPNKCENCPFLSAYEDAIAELIKPIARKTALNELAKHDLLTTENIEQIGIRTGLYVKALVRDKIEKNFHCMKRESE